MVPFLTAASEQEMCVSRICQIEERWTLGLTSKVKSDTEGSTELIVTSVSLSN